jgi:esterase/lipase superfamily enzyme
MPSRGRATYATLGILVVVLLTAFAAYRAYFSTTDAAIRHAEAFLFRRMTVAQLAEQGEYRFFYSTNRIAENGSEDLETRFTSEREASLKFGTFDAAIQPSLGLGMLINPTEWFQNEEIRLKNVDSLEREVFIEQLRQVVGHSPHRGLLIVVHGFRERYPSALRKTAFLGHVLDINAPTLVFDWPGNQGSSLNGYRRAHEVARESGTELAELLKLVIAEVDPERLWLFANSMGAQVVADAFGILYQQAEFADAEIELDDVILTAPDVAQDEFDARFRDEIAALTDELTVYVSSNDRALLVSRIINRGARRGESTLRPEQLEEATRVADLTRPEDNLVTLVDVTPVNRTRNFHNFSLETPEFFDDLFLRLTNEKTPRSRLIYRVQTPEDQVYWVLTQGR